MNPSVPTYDTAFIKQSVRIHFLALKAINIILAVDNFNDRNHTI